MTSLEIDTGTALVPPGSNRPDFKKRKLTYDSGSA
jgi:hypothetical protein